MHSGFILLLISSALKLKFYLSLFLIAIASNVIIERLRKFSKMASEKEKEVKLRSLAWDLIILVMAVLLIKYEGDFILSLIGADK